MLRRDTFSANGRVPIRRFKYICLLVKLTDLRARFLFPLQPDSIAAREYFSVVVVGTNERIYMMFVRKGEYNENVRIIVWCDQSV